MPPDTLEGAKAEMREAMIAAAKRNGIISYSGLSESMNFLLSHRSPHFYDFLNEISREEHEAGRGMLSAVVVSKSGQSRGIPADGFFKLAKSLGHQFDDGRTFWNQELERVHRAWPASGGTQP